MTEATNDRIEKIFVAALERPPAQRRAYIAEACGADEALRGRVESLLKDYEQAGGFLRAPADETADTVRTPAGAAAEGTRIGHYTIRRVIATGGMGVVYEAVQEQPHRTVALKVMKAGIASSSALRRFEYEAQILARLRHPHIAQVYEAGTHDDGTGAVPYFAMEYIPNAKSLTEYAREKNLDTRQRLELFAGVCAAVHHGHQKGIIHRDLKPANILVDSAGAPKVIDFGVARATDSDMAVTTLQTDVGQLIGTLQYMSPEQCQADPHDLDSRSDVYALGVVLYELLCGEMPYDLTHAAVHDAVRVIREEPPTKPSTVNRTLRGDLETITLKALAKERERRYQGANDLASDIDRYLNDQPIVARPPSVRYQLAKFARRNKALLGGAVGMLVLLVAGTIVSSYGFIQANRQRVAVEREAAKAVVIKEFLGDVVGAADLVEAGGNLTPVQIMDQAVRDIDERFAGQPEIEAEVRHLIGQAYGTRGEFAKAIEFLEVALEVRRRELGAEHPDTLETSDQLGRVLYWNRRLDEAEALQRYVVEARTRVLGGEHEDTFWAMARLAMTLAWRQDVEEAEALARRAVEGLARALGEEHSRTLSARAIYRAVLYHGDKLDEASEVARRNLESCQHALGDEHPQTIHARWHVGALLIVKGSAASLARATCRQRTC
jgi:serine/threonine protein kinase